MSDVAGPSHPRGGRGPGVREVDVVVLGAGPAGENAAQYAVQGSSRTAALVEAELLGGECSYHACIPSKALLRPLDIAAAAAHLPGLSTPELDPAGLLARRDDWVSGYDDAGQVAWAEGAGVEVVRGRGRLVGEREVEVTSRDGASQRLRAREAVVVATGSVPVVPDLYAGIEPWGSRDATGVVEVPESLAIVGGGVVACEAARWMAALGADVTLLVRSGGLLGRAEPFAGELVADGLRAAGVDVRLGVDVASADRREGRDTGLGRVHGGPVTLTLAGGETRTVAEVLVATGRRPATSDLGLEELGLDPRDLGRGGGRVGGAPLPEWLFLVGDAAGSAPLTHWGKHEARHVGRAIAARADGAARPLDVPAGPVPQVVFTDPQVAWVGETLRDARAEGHDARARDADLAAVAGTALLRDDAAGRARLVVGADDRVLGATFVGPEAGELLHAATIAVAAGLDLATLRRAVPSFPTASEVWLSLLEG